MKKECPTKKEGRREADRFLAENENELAEFSKTVVSPPESSSPVSEDARYEEIVITANAATNNKLERSLGTFSISSFI
jgi:hypothetical protein